MKRTTIFVPESLERDLQLYAARAGKSTASVVREALTEYVVAKRRASGALPSFAGAFASGYTDTAERHEALLFKKAGRAGPAPRRPVSRKRVR